MAINGLGVSPRRSRFAVLWLAVQVSLPAFLVFRLVLLMRHYDQIDEPFYRLMASLLLGVIGDLAFLTYLLIPFAVYLLLVPERWYRSGLNKIVIYSVFFICLYGLYFDLVAEWLFWDEFSVRFNFIAVDYLIYTHEVFNNIIESYPLTGLLSGIFAATAVTFMLFRRKLAEHLTPSEYGFFYRLRTGLVLMSLPIVSYAAVSQSLHHISDNKFINEIAANGPYQFFAAFKNNEIDYRQFYALGQEYRLSDDIKKVIQSENGFADKSELFDIRRRISAEGPEKRLNVIMITVESLSADYLTYFGSQDNVTPFLDHWTRQGLLFTNFYATGTRTTRGLEALTLSIPPTAGRSIVKRPDNANVFNLGRVFQQKGYDTVFLYGGRGYFDNMNEFFSGNGYRIVDQNDLSEAEIQFENAWGVSDEDLFRRALKEADREYAGNKPFLFQIMTTSNHRPFTYPEGKIDIPSGTGRLGAVKYTDYALKEFIEAAETKPWFGNTLFVLVADHCAGSARKAELPVENYHIPLFIYAPKHVTPARIDTLSSQIDVAPTVLGLLNFSYDSQFFGKDILKMRPDEGRALIGNYQKLGLFKNNKLVYLSPQQQISIINDPLNKAEPQGIEQNRALVEEDMAYYQAADYIWKHRLNRYRQ
ncbi:MAG: LTA synthase family protein [Gammaproteobacteria bacterium]